MQNASDKMQNDGINTPTALGKFQNNSQKRFEEIDILRGIAILMVVVFHIFYDLNYFHIASFDMHSGALMLFGRLAAFILIFIVGISLHLSHERANAQGKNSFLKYAKRSLGLFAIAALISLATYIYPHDGFIFFGIIHFIALAVLIGYFFLDFYYLNLAVGILFILAGEVLSQMQTSNIFLFILGMNSNFYTLDYYPIFPWIGIVLLGMFAGKSLYEKQERKFSICIPNAKIMRFFDLCGQNSLLIYIVHQPIIICILAMLGYAHIF
ncbi:MAG: heparan-alpha-glucosaminide N-acetyltransferase [Candidatus Micrarchaeia archaeon]